MKKEAIAIITARGGSKRIPKKNIKKFCGKPIIAYSIEAALNSGIFDEVMVSTDSEEIADIAKSYGAKIPFMRSEKTANDYATTAEVLLEVLNEYKNIGQEFEYMACIYPTAPFVTEEKLKLAFKIMKEKKPIEVMPVVAFSYPPQRSYIIDENGYIKYKYPKYMLTRSQDLEKEYHDAGQFYVYHISQYLKCNGKIKDKIIPMIVSELEIQDIDNEEDWEIAELKYGRMKARKSLE